MSVMLCKCSTVTCIIFFIITFTCFCYLIYTLYINGHEVLSYSVRSLDKQLSRNGLGGFLSRSGAVKKKKKNSLKLIFFRLTFVFTARRVFYVIDI